MKRFTPLIIALSLILGILIGTFCAYHFSDNRLSIINTGSNKINYLLQMIDNSYVDTINMSDVIEKALPELLRQLDPHSAYIPAKEVDEANEELRGSFSGIGVQFVIEHDTITVMNVIPGGPSEKVGLMAGDRIIRIDGENYVGKVVTDTGAIHRLKGPKDTKVRLVINRLGEKSPLSFTIVRGDIPMHSIDCSYIIPSTKTGYIRIKSFGETTYGEMLSALVNFQNNGFSSLIIDLRGNRGGYMQTAIQMANEFLPSDRLIVYTEGRKMRRENYYSDGRGTFQRIPFVVLIDEGSASASEIFAGAMQDNDRALIMGRRSFGKGLVQQPMEFRDGSQVRLTVARYYTPSGRCIQKPYVDGHDESYENDLIARYGRGEFFSSDSIKQDGPEYHTVSGKVVYGGGGIMPDTFVPEDTTAYTSYFKEASYRGLIRQFSFAYTDKNRSKLAHLHSIDSIVDFIKHDNIIDRFATFAAERGLQRRNLMIQRSAPLFERFLYGAVVYDIMNADKYQQYLNRFDNTVRTALDSLNKN